MYFGGYKVKSNIQSRYAIILLSIFFLVGTVGMLRYAVFFQSLTPFHLGLTALMLLWFAPQKDAFFTRFVILVTVAGFALEIAGVKTGKIFGAYQYGHALGVKFGGVPLIIGVNWLIMVLSSMSLADYFPLGDFGKSVMGALAMTFLDFLIEQVAPVYHFWYFDQLLVPLKNYIAWFFIGLLFHYFGRQLGITSRNPLGTPVFIMMTLFFLILAGLNFFI
jgi:putative membrane protein